MAYPSVITPRTMGQAIHLCFSEGRSSGSLMVTTSPDGLRQAIVPACGGRIITPSSTPCPPTRVSSPLSSAGKSCTATRKRTKFRKERTVIRCPRRRKAPSSRLSQGWRRSHAGWKRQAVDAAGFSRAVIREESAIRDLSSILRNVSLFSVFCFLRQDVSQQHAKACGNLRGDRRHDQEVAEDGNRR